MISIPIKATPLQWVALAIIVAGLIVGPMFLDPGGYTVRILALMVLFAALGQCWNLVGGLANQISLGHAAYFGIGAYASTILLNDFGLSPWIGTLVGIGLAMLVALLLSIPTFRLQGHYFALATLAAGEVMRSIANAWASLTEGPVGISTPFMLDDSLWMMNFADTRPMYYIILVALLVITVIFWWIKSSALGYRLRAVRENQDAAEVVGVDTFRTKLIVSLLSAGLTAFLGTLYAHYQFFFDPDTVFGIASISVRMALIAILGGVGAVFGPWVGAAFIIPMEEIANTQLGGEIAGLSQFAYGMILVVVILLQPKGLIAMITNGWRLLTRGARRSTDTEGGAS